MATDPGRKPDHGVYQDQLAQLPSQPQAAAEASQNLGKRKRNRVPVACFNCRAVKTKCDGDKPSCSTCLASGQSCHYSPRGIKTNPKLVMVEQEYLQSLERRLNVIEQEKDISTPALRSSLPQTPNSEILLKPATTSRHDPHTEREYSIPRSRKPMASIPSNENSLDVSADPNVFMGGVSFTQLILNAMNGQAIGLRTKPFSSTITETSVAFPAYIYELPNNVRELIRKFFDQRHQLSPVFHEPTILPVFDKVISAPVTERYHYRYPLAIINMILSICSSHRLNGVDGSPSIARQHYDIGIALLQPTLLRDWNLEKVQALLLGSRFLQSSNAPDECWNVLGHAIRIAYGLELHRPPPEDEPYNLKETKKRVWYACFTLDKLLSMIYGLPSAILTTECTCPLPEDLDDDCIFPDRVLYPSPRKPSSISFSIEVVKLYRILESATHLAESADDAMTGETLAQNVLALDEKYQKWYNALPPELILDDTKYDEKALILALRANMIRILIHRHSLELTLKDLHPTSSAVAGGIGITHLNHKRTSPSVKGNILQYSRDICVSAAIETIDIVGLRHE